jgi:catechol 2,3-dioxygenase-like lactoylglutathione lyase family enzyme
MRKLQSQGIHHITLTGADRQTSIDFWESTRCIWPTRSRRSQAFAGVALGEPIAEAALQDGGETHG